MASKDLTPEQWEDLVESDHSCDESCAGGDHSRSWTEQPPDELTTALALFECGRAGRFGSTDPTYAPSLLWRHAKEVLGLTSADLKDNALALESVSIKYRELLQAWDDELRACDVIRRAQEETERVVRRETRRQLAALRRAEPREDVRSPNRTTRVDVDPAAWEVVKRKAILDGRKVAEAVGDLLTKPILPKRSHTSARVARRHARLFIDDDQWTEVRATAVTRGVTVARLIGVIVEREAKRLGWTPESSR